MRGGVLFMFVLMICIGFVMPLGFFMAGFIWLRHHMDGDDSIDEMEAQLEERRRKIND